MGDRLVRGPLSAQIAQHLARSIEDRGMRPGDVLPSENKLAKEFSVSRPVIREALKSLAGQGILEIFNGKGAVVRALDASALSSFFNRAVRTEDDALMELMEVRKPLEAQSARLAAERRTSEEVARMAKTVSAMGERLEDPEAYAERDVEFHLLVAEATRNKMMGRLIGSIRESMKDAVLEGLRRRHTQRQLERVQELHEAILEKIEQGDAEGAERAMVAHFDDAVTALVGENTRDPAVG